jgi:hypothetical protein
MPNFFQEFNRPDIFLQSNVAREFGLMGLTQKKNQLAKKVIARLSRLPETIKPNQRLLAYCYFLSEDHENALINYTEIVNQMESSNQKNGLYSMGLYLPITNIKLNNLDHAKEYLSDIQDSPRLGEGIKNYFQGVIYAHL